MGRLHATRKPKVIRWPTPPRSTIINRPIRCGRSCIMVHSVTLGKDAQGEVMVPEN